MVISTYSVVAVLYILLNALWRAFEKKTQKAPAAYFELQVFNHKQPLETFDENRENA